jgi:hypothetical protein
MRESLPIAALNADAAASGFSVAFRAAAASSAVAAR